MSNRTVLYSYHSDSDFTKVMELLKHFPVLHERSGKVHVFYYSRGRCSETEAHYLEKIISATVSLYKKYETKPFFVCEECGCTKLEEVMVDATVTSIVTEKDPEDGSFSYGDVTIDNGTLSHYQCGGCGVTCEEFNQSEDSDD